MRPLSGFEMINFFSVLELFKKYYFTTMYDLLMRYFFLYLKTDVLKLCFLSRPWHAPQIQAEDLEQKYNV